MSRMPPRVRSSFLLRRSSNSFFVKPDAAMSSKSRPSSSLSRWMRLMTVKVGQHPPNQRWFTYGMPTRVACSAIASWACFLVPTKSTWPPRATVSLTNA